MRTTIDVDDALVTEAMEITDARTINSVVEEGLRLLVRLANQRSAVEDIQGLGWEGDLDSSRRP